MVYFLVAESTHALQNVVHGKLPIQPVQEPGVPNIDVAQMKKDLSARDERVHSKRTVS